MFFKNLFGHKSTKQSPQPVQPTQDADVVHVNRWLEDTEKSLKKTGFYKKYPLNEFWEKLNVPNMQNILKTSSTQQEVLTRIQDTNYFIVSFNSSTTERAIDWQIDYLRQHQPETWKILSTIGESLFVEDALKFKRDNQAFTLDTFRIAQIACRVFSLFNLKPEKKHVFVELGAGLGHLGRFIMSMSPQSTYVLIDLPISLCFSYLFIKNNFPDKKLLLLEANQELTPALLNSYDIIFSSVGIVESKQQLPVDVFINTCSLGEMINASSLAWIEYVQNVLKPKGIYSLNRFLNHTDESPDYAWRKNENAQSIHLFSAYEVKSFNLEDRTLFGPYFDCLHPRYLELALVQQDKTLPRKNHTADLAKLMLDQFWLKYYLPHYWPINYRGAQLSNDFTTKGMLFALWNNARCFPDALSYLLLLIYLDNLNRDNLMPFEEVSHLEALVLQHVGVYPEYVQASTNTYITFRQQIRKKSANATFAKDRGTLISEGAETVEFMLRYVKSDVNAQAA